MEFCETKKAFIDRWGKISGNWGVCKGMAQIHALLLISPKSLSSLCIMEELDMSSGSVNTKLRELMEWGLVYKCPNITTRREYFRAEKDMLIIFKQILENRKKRELDPILELLNELDEYPAKCPDSEEFIKVLSEIKSISQKIDSTLDSVLSTDKQWMVNTFFKLVR